MKLFVKILLGLVILFFLALGGMLSYVKFALPKVGDAPDLQIEAIAETRSGSAISGIGTSSSGDGGYVAVFKDGQKRKLKEERQRVKGWHEIYPGLAPKILDYRKRGQSASLLIEHLPGLTMEQILLHESPALLEEALDQLGSTLRSVWNETCTATPISADFMGQLSARLTDVYKIHPEFQHGGREICGLEVAPFEQVINSAQVVEADLPAPFSPTRRSARSRTVPRPKTPSPLPTKSASPAPSSDHLDFRIPRPIT